jgi:DNA-directed RNA polymerase subunit RPC12/RpoP
MDVVSYKCPSCGAPLSFNIDSQAWDCKYCGSRVTMSEIENTDIAGPDVPEPEPVYEALDEDIKAFECPSCGGHIITDANTAATFCVYCHNPAIIASRLRDDRRPDWIIPFKLKKDEAVAAVQKLCKRKPLLPKEFRESVAAKSAGCMSRTGSFAVMLTVILKERGIESQRGAIKTTAM